MDSGRRSDSPTALAAKHGLPADLKEADVREQAERVRASVPFRSSRRCVLFLDFVVQAALEGRWDSLKERTIGVEVFGRPPNYDTNQDPVVRGTASEVRKRLAQYYQAPGREPELRIELPSGSYLPEFHRPTAVAPPMVAAPLPVAQPRSSWRLFAAIAAAVCIVLTAVVIRSVRKSPTVVDRLWAPILQSSESVLLCVGQPKVYNLLDSLNAEITKRMPGPDHILSTAEANEKLTVTVGEIVPNWDRYLALGDAECLSDIAALLATRGHAYHIRGGGSTSFADLRENPTVLIGAFTNDWTMRLTGQLRFTFESENDTMHYVHDRLHPTNRDWQLTHVWPDWKMPLDYAIVSRVLDPTTGKMIVTAAGITHYGTEAAGEFLTNPEYLAELLRQAPSNWQKENIQVVLSTKVIGGTAGPPNVLAVQFW